MSVFSWYMKREWLDMEPGIEAVYIHYTWTPLGTPPDWRQHRETRLMEQGATIREGMGGTTIVEDQIVNTEMRERPSSSPANARIKVLKLPTRIQDPECGEWTETYLFHHYFEVHQHGRVWTTDLFTEEIVSQDIEYVDYEGHVSGACAHWSLFDFDAQQYVPSETQAFIDRFGEDNEFRSFKLYRYPDRNHFTRQKLLMMREIPPPHRWHSKVWGPRGAEIIQGWHVGFVDELTPPGQPLPIREEWVGYRTFILGQEAQPEVEAAASAPAESQPPLSQVMDAHAQIESQVGEIYVTLAGRFAGNAELHTMWSLMALDEGGHAALLRAISKGLLSGVFRAKPTLLPLASLDTLVAQVANCRRLVEAGVDLQQALHLTWELEASELDFLRDLLIASSNLAELGFPTTLEDRDTHTARLREAIEKYTSDETLRREARFVTAAAPRPDLALGLAGRGLEARLSASESHRLSSSGSGG